MDRIEDLLAEEAVIEPSSGFATRVMESVRLEAATPPPITFPWHRVRVGLGAFMTSAAVVFVAAAIRGDSTSAVAVSRALLDAIGSPWGRGLTLAGLATIGSLVTAALALRGADRPRPTGTF